MNRTLRVKRIYSQGQYQNIEIEDNIFEVPEKFALDSKFVDLVSYLQLLGVERKYARYEILRAKYRTVTPEEASLLIEDEINETKTELDRYVQEK